MHVPQVVTPVLLVELLLKSHNKVVVLDRICDVQQLLGDLPVFKQVGDLRPVVEGFLLQTVPAAT